MPDENGTLSVGTGDFGHTGERVVENSEEHDTSSREETGGSVGKRVVDGTDDQSLEDGSDRYNGESRDISHLHLVSPDHSEFCHHAVFGKKSSQLVSHAESTEGKGDERVRDEVGRLLASPLDVLGVSGCSVSVDLVVVLSRCENAKLLLSVSDVLLAQLALRPVVSEFVGILRNVTLETFSLESSLGIGTGDEEIGRSLTRLRFVSHSLEVLDCLTHRTKVDHSTVVDDRHLVEKLVELFTSLNEGRNSINMAREVRDMILSTHLIDGKNSGEVGNIGSDSKSASVLESGGRIETTSRVVVASNPAA